MAGGRKTWRGVIPRVAFAGLLVSIAIQRAHIVLVKIFLVIGVEFVANEGEIELRSRAVGNQKYAVEIADTIVVDQGGDGSRGDW